MTCDHNRYSDIEIIPSKTELEQPSEAQAAPGWRIKLGFAFFIYGLIVNPLLIAILTLIGGTRFAAILGGLLVFGEVMLVAGAAIAGKEGYAYIKGTVFGFIKKFGPPQKVSRIRIASGCCCFSYRSLLVGPYPTSWNIFRGT